MINTLPRQLSAILIGLISLDIMVLIHEFGHYLAARLMRIDVDYLQLGFGPEIKTYTAQNVSIKFSAIPFGGLCKLDELSVVSVNPVKRILLYLAGPFSNTISAFVFFTIYLLIIKKAFTESVSLSINQILIELRSFIDAIGMLITGKAKLSEILSGTFIASSNIGNLTELGFKNGFISGICMMLYLFASVSLSLGVANLLPIPALDGGFILIGLIELITKHSFTEKFYLFTQILGLIILLVILPVARLIY